VHLNLQLGLGLVMRLHHKQLKLVVVLEHQLLLSQQEVLTELLMFKQQ